MLAHQMALQILGPAERPGKTLRLGAYSQNPHFKMMCFATTI